MAYDLRANQVRLNRIISSGSIPILIYPSSSATNLQGGKNFPDPGSDVFLFVSGSSTAKTVFGGDVITSGSFRSFSGITGSVQYTDASSTPFIIAGPNITASYNSLGQWEISGSTPVSYFTSPTNGVVQTTGSLLAVSLSSSNGAQVTGSLEVRGGITGSISGTITGNPFIIAGPGATVNYNSLGQWAITSSVVGSDYWVSTTNQIVYTTGSAYATTLSASAGAIITGSLTQGTGILQVGINAHAEGNGTSALGASSHAEGTNTYTTIFATNSHAEGNSTTAGGVDSHAEGVSTTSKGQGSHAEGKDTTAFGDGSHAEGSGSYAGANYSHAGGLCTNTAKDYQTAVGQYNLPNNTTSLFVVGDGINDTSKHDILRVETGNIQVTGSLISPQITGSLSGTVGGYPFIVGGPNITASYNSLGQWEITGSAGGGGGSSTNYWASNVNNVIYTTGSANATILSASVGIVVTGSLLHGYATGAGAVSANAYGGHAQGYNVHADARYSHAEGSGSRVNGAADGAHAEGESVTVFGVAAHAEGYSTEATPRYSHAEGDHSKTQAGADASHAEGYYTQTYGKFSHAEGVQTIAYGAGSHAGGLWTIASGSLPTDDSPTFVQTAYGKYNKRNNTTSLFVVGDGTGDSDALRHDILRVESGSVQITGSLISPQITGSIKYVSNTTPFIVGSNGVVVNYNSSGQYELTGSGSGGGSVISSSLTVTGDTVNQGSGSIGGLFTLSERQVGKYNVQVVAVDSAGKSSATWDFSVSGFYPTSGSFTFLGINELTFEHTPSAATWDVNFNSAGQIEVTGSTAVEGTFFYTQIFAKMIGSFGTVVV